MPDPIDEQVGPLSAGSIDYQQVEIPVLVHIGPGHGDGIVDGYVRLIGSIGEVAGAVVEIEP